MSDKPTGLGKRALDAAKSTPADNEARFQAWYGPLARKLHIAPNPDDPEHYYDYRAFHRDMEAGKVLAPDAPGGHFPSTYKLPGHPRTFLDDANGRVFDARSAQYLTGEPVPQEQLTASEHSPDKPGFDPGKLKQVAAVLSARRR
jgi:hypothetical protein